eukprot:1119513-Heterocapsa_arctica.AAC.1
MRNSIRRSVDAVAFPSVRRFQNLDKVRSWVIRENTIFATDFPDPRSMAFADYIAAANLPIVLRGT